jgi:outer membrane protein assembly factor BamB
MPETAARRTIPTLRTLITLTVLAMLALPAAGDWSRFRGPNGSGVGDGDGLPVELGPDRNVDWKTAVPFGRSSPVLTKDRLFLSAVEDGKLVTLALDRASGKVVWRAELKRGETAEFHEATDSSTSSPVTDGTNVYVFFHEAGLVSYDGSGAERWRLPMGPFRNFYGIAASPVLAGDTLVMVCDQAEGSFLTAVDTKTGKVLWNRKRPGRVESYATPVLVPPSKPRMVVVSGARWVDAYDLATGEEVWTAGGVGSGPVSSPILLGDTVFINAPDHAEDGWSEFGPLLEEHDKNKDGSLSREEVAEMWIADHFGWLDADADGSISAEDWKHVGATMVNDNWGLFAIRMPKGKGEAKTLWNYRKNVPYITSPLLYEGVLYLVKDDIVTSLDPETGKMLKRGRLEGISGKVYASPIAADGKIYIGTLEGQVAVLKAGAEWSVLQTNDLGEEIWASPAIADGHLYVRTKESLYSFAAKKKPPEAAQR